MHLLPEEGYGFQIIQIHKTRLIQSFLANRFLLLIGVNIAQSVHSIWSTFPIATQWKFMSLLEIILCFDFLNIASFNFFRTCTTHCFHHAFIFQFMIQCSFSLNSKVRNSYSRSKIFAAEPHKEGLGHDYYLLSYSLWARLLNNRFIGPHLAHV